MATEAWKKQNIEKLRKYRRDWYYRNRKYARTKAKERKTMIRKWFKNYKSSLSCEMCGENHIACLDFHHDNPNQKDLNVSSVINQGWSKQRIMKELDKCTVLCSNCHRKLHYK